MSIIQETTFNVIEYRGPYKYSDMKDIKCHLVAVIKGREVPFIPIEKVLPVAAMLCLS